MIPKRKCFKEMWVEQEAYLPGTEVVITEKDFKAMFYSGAAALLEYLSALDGMSGDEQEAFLHATAKEIGEVVDLSHDPDDPKGPK